MMAGTPKLLVGQGDTGKAYCQYATAISPARINATGRVNQPRSMNGPPKVSSTPANHGSDRKVIAGTPAGIGGKPKSFIVPDEMNTAAATIRKMLSIRPGQGA